MRSTQKAAEAAVEATRLSRDLRDDNNISSSDTLLQMKGQSRAMRVSADAMKSASAAASDQVQKLQAGVTQTTKLASAAENANKIAQQAINAQTRPWLGIESDLTSIKTDISEKNIYVSFDFRLRNYGQSPAIKVSHAFDFSLPYKYLRAGTAQTAACERAERASSVVDKPDFFPSIILASIFPGDSGVSTIHGGAGFDRPDPASITTPNVLVGCIVYQGTKDGILHHARIMYVVSSRDNDGRIKSFTLTGTGTD